MGKDQLRRRKGHDEKSLPCQKALQARCTTDGLDCVLFHAKSLGDFYADQFPGKMMRANVVPAVKRTSEFPNPVFSALGLPSFLNRFTYTLADLGLAMMGDAVRQFRDELSLGSKFDKHPPLPSLYSISEHFLPRPKDFPSDSCFSGFWHSSSPQDLSEQIKYFITSGKKNIPLTFGSMPFEFSFNLPEAIREMAKALRVNVIVVKGWGFANNETISSDEVLFIDHAPYERLFPKMDGIVHHGGIGTIAECLCAGVPFFSCPVIYPIGDQHFWAQQANRRGVGLPPVPLKRFTKQILTGSMRMILTDNDLKARAGAFAHRLKDEDGTRKAVNYVESVFTKR